MAKKILFLFTLILTVCSLTMISGCKKNSTNETNSSSSLEENKTSTDNNDQSEKESSDQNNKIVSDGGPVWNKEEHNAAEKFANELVTLIKNKDIDSISKRVSYPFEMEIDGKRVKIPNKKKFVSIGFDKIFSNDLIKQINNTSKLFSNQYGFCLGETGEIWFSPMMETDEIKITAINN